MGLAIIILLLDFLIAIVFNSNLQSIYPFPKVPWGMPTQREAYITEITFYIYAVALAFPYNFIAIPYMNGVAAALTLVANFYSSTYYDVTISKAIAIN